MPATIREIVDDALEFVGEVAGVGTQQFAEDRMFNDAVRAFNMLFKKYDWHQFRTWFRLSLDGVLGQVTTDDLWPVRDFEDFVAVYRDGETCPVPVLPKQTNPFMLKGALVRYWTSLHSTNANYVKRKLLFYPVASIGFVNILAKIYPLVPVDPAIVPQWDWNDTMDLDRDMLVYATAFITLVGDDLNASAADMAKTLMEGRFSDITAKLGSHAIPLTGASPIPNQWFMAI